MEVTSVLIFLYRFSVTYKYLSLTLSFFRMYTKLTIKVLLKAFYLLTIASAYDLEKT